MCRRICFFIRLCALFGLLSLTSSRGSTYGFAIYLAKTTASEDRSSTLYIDGSAIPKDVELYNAPVLTEADLLSYKRERLDVPSGIPKDNVSREFVYVVTVKPSAISRLRTGLFRDVAAGVGKSEMIGFSDRAFVLYALDKPIYVGVFNSVVSSTAYGVPTIKEPVYDKGKGSWELRIYPASGDPRAKDLRNSPIIEKALKQSGIVLQGL